ncbi:MAG: hypothetical protein JST75_17405 [Bacteroidetes bacterium]|nr:hypothetical protein [Bacteroidota bacterium]
MKTTNDSRKPFSYVSAMIVGLALLFSFTAANAQSGKCSDCFVSSFGAITVYHVAQPGTNFGFGFEAGSWNKDESPFSYFIGTKMQWFKSTGDKSENTAERIRYSVYVKGQYEVINRLYVVVAPAFVNLSSFETQAGLRYVFPLSKFIGVGIEPAYSFVQKQYSVNTNIHFALK